MNLTNSLVRTYLLRYKKVLERIKYDSLKLQEKELALILKSPISQFKQIQSKDRFNNLKITSYSDYEKEINKRLDRSERNIYNQIKYFAKSAGTTSNGSKYVPTSNEFLRRNHIQASWLALAILYFLRPDMDVFSRKYLLVGGAIYERTKDRTVADISGLMIQNIPRPFHKYYVPTIEEATNPDWEIKLGLTAKKAAADPNVVLFAGVPTWILTLAKEVLNIASRDNLLEVWPHVKAYIHGGVRFDPYRLQFKELLPDKNFIFLEVYNASEGFIAVQDTREHQGLLLLTGHGIYYEFIRVENYRNGDFVILNLDKIELNTTYVLLITNNSGLYRYIIGDTLSFISKHPFRLRINGRISDFINAFGENLNLNTVENALSIILIYHDALIRDYSVAPKYISMENRGYHQWFIEFEKPPLNIAKFALDLDNKIQELNFEYRQKRVDFFGLEKPTNIRARSWVFLQFFEKKKSTWSSNKNS